MNLLTIVDYYKSNPNRSLTLDFLRGFAIILMIFFHLSFDLSHFHFIDIDIYNREGTFWRDFRYIILSLFLFCVGVSLQIVYSKKIVWEKVGKRFALLLVFASLITAMSFMIFPKTWIYFGVIHFIALASLLGLIFVNRAYLSLTVAILNLLLYILGYLHHKWMFTPFLEYLPKHTEDLVTVTPWFSLVLFGIVAGKLEFHKKVRVPLSSFTSSIGFLGRHSLIIYMVHQPILFGIVSGIYTLTK